MQLDLLGMINKTTALQVVEENANHEWMTAAVAAVRKVALRQVTLTTDDVWDELKGNDLSTHEPRAMGAVMSKCARDGLITRTDRVIPTRRSSANCRPITIWYSLMST